VRPQIPFHHRVPYAGDRPHRCSPSVRGRWHRCDASVRDRRMEAEHQPA
jgi:hypothetical protein